MLSSGEMDRNLRYLYEFNYSPKQTAVNSITGLLWGSGFVRVGLCGIMSYPEIPDGLYGIAGRTATGIMQALTFSCISVLR
jgi:hypothetical protein